MHGLVYKLGEVHGRHHSILFSVQLLEESHGCLATYAHLQLVNSVVQCTLNLVCCDSLFCRPVDGTVFILHRRHLFGKAFW